MLALMRRLMLLLAWLAGSTLFAAPGTIILVRHAETAPGGTRDPHLSEAGRTRAAVLAEFAKQLRVTNVFTSQYRRTIQTAAPGAEAVGSEVRQVPAQEPEALLAQVLALPPGAVVLLVGHSNTVPDLARRLSGTEVAEIEETEYDRLLLLTARPDGQYVIEERGYPSSP